MTVEEHGFPELDDEPVEEPAESEPAIPEPEPAAEPEPAFPEAQAKRLEDDSIYRQRMIPEEIDAKLETPTDLPNNGRSGPLKIGSSVADTQIFRKVLAGLSGSEVEGLSGEKVEPPKKKPKAKQDKTAEPAPPAQETEAEPLPQPAPELAAEPEPESVAMKASGEWPPKKPSDDEDWDDTLDTSA